MCTTIYTTIHVGVSVVCVGGTQKRRYRPHTTLAKKQSFSSFSSSFLSQRFFSLRLFYGESLCPVWSLKLEIAAFFSKNITQGTITMKKDRSKRKKHKKTKEAIARAKAWAENRKNRSQVPIAAMVQNTDSAPQLVQEKSTENLSVTDIERQLMLTEEAMLTLQVAASNAYIREVEEKIRKSDLVLEQMRKEYDERLKRIENNLIQDAIKAKVIEALMTVIDDDDN